MLEEIGKEQRDFVFVTPEQQDRHLRHRGALHLAMGHDFRPSYLHLREVIAALGDLADLALTATAT